MPLFGRRPEKPSDEERVAAAVDIKRIAQGGIPLGAEQRLSRLREQSEPFFTSDLSVKEYALARASGLQPLAQVMGSSVVQHGWSNFGWNTLGGYGGAITEIASLAQPWNLSRVASFDRLRQEAAAAGADAVIGIELAVTPFLEDPNQVELAVFGTAVRETTLDLRAAAGGRRPAPGPRLSTLSGQDVDKLRRIGAETVDVIGHTAVVCVSLSPWADRQMSAWWGNQEMTEVTQGVYAARQLVMGEIERQGRALGANDMVISTLRHDIHHQEYEANGYTHHYFLVSMHVLATALRLGAHPPHPSPLPTPRMAIDLSDA